jgi:dihydrofolate reductase
VGTISVIESITLDGVVQGVGRADEDTRGGFAHGGWGQGYQDPVIGEFMARGMSAGGVMLFGRRTYDDVLGAWTARLDPHPVTDHLVAAPKYVVSRSASTPLPHPNSTLLAGEAADTVAALRAGVDGAISVIGSGALVRALWAAGLVDALVLLVHPIALGSGTRLFGPGERRDLRLERTVASTTGVVIAQYAVVR